MSEQAFRIMNEPITFKDRAFLAIATKWAVVKNTSKGRRMECDIQAAWDLAEAMSQWREKMTKSNE